MDTNDCPTGLPADMPDYMRPNDSLARSVRRSWLQRNHPHHYWHEEVRLAKRRLSAAGHRSQPAYKLPIARQELDEALAGLAAYHAQNVDN